MALQFHELDRYLPPELRQDFQEALAGRMTPERKALVVEHLLDLERASSSRADDDLRRLSPDVAINNRIVERAIRNSDSGPALANPGANRFVWIIGVAGSGTSRSIEVLTSYFKNAALWYVASFASNLLVDTEPDVAVGIAANYIGENIRRISHTIVQYRWAAQLIAESAADVIKEEAERLAPMRAVTRDAVDELFRELAALATESNPASYPRHHQSDGAVLAELLSVRAGSLAHSGFARMVYSTQIEKYPYVAFGDEFVPLGLREALYAFDQALLELARTKLAKGDRGYFFERLVSRSLSQVRPADLTAIPGTLNVEVPGTKNPGEIDFGFKSDAGLLIGECKAYFVTADSRSVINAFGSQMRKAVDQLMVRLSALDSGSPLLAPQAEVSEATRHTRVLAIAVPLHSYGGALWDSDSLSEIDSLQERVAIIPLHSLILVARSMQNYQDLYDYVSVRTQLLHAGTLIQDEFDILVFYLGPILHQTMASLPAMVEQGTPALRTFSVVLATAANERRPFGPDPWRESLFEAAK